MLSKYRCCDQPKKIKLNILYIHQKLLNMLTDYLHITDQGKKISKAVAIFSFFLLFPGFLFYHQFLAMELIPRFAAGFFGYVSLGALLAFIVLLPWDKDWLNKITGSRYVLWVLVFLFYTSVWTIAHYLFLSGDYITKASVQSLQTVIFWSCLFLIGLLLPLESKFLRWSFLVSFIVILVFLLYFSVSTGSNSYFTRRIYGQTTDISSYQGFARSVLFTLLLLLAVFNSFRARACLMLGGVFVLFMLISRSEFYSFLAVCGALCVISGFRQPKYFLLLLLIFLEVITLAAPDIMPRVEFYLKTLSQDNAVETSVVGKPDAADNMAREPVSDKPVSADNAAPPSRLNRQFEVLRFSSSKSWERRLALQRTAVRQISENPLMGNFGGHVLKQDSGKYAKGHTGRYAHNALSAWVTYGLAGFILYFSLTLAGLLVPARQVILKRQNTPPWMFAFMLNFVCLLLIIVSKSVYWPLPALGWGVTAKVLADSTLNIDDTVS